MNTEEYRCLVGHLMYWKRGLNEALVDTKLSHLNRDDVIDRLFKAGYTYDQNTDTLTYNANSEDSASDTNQTLDENKLKWHIPENLRWLGQQSDRPDYVPAGMLTGAFLNQVANDFEKMVKEIYGVGSTEDPKPS